MDAKATVKTGRKEVGVWLKVRNAFVKATLRTKVAQKLLGVWGSKERVDACLRTHSTMRCHVAEVSNILTRKGADAASLALLRLGGGMMITGVGVLPGAATAGAGVYGLHAAPEAGNAVAAMIAPPGARIPPPNEGGGVEEHKAPPPDEDAEAGNFLPVEIPEGMGEAEAMELVEAAMNGSDVQPRPGAVVEIAGRTFEIAQREVNPQGQIAAFGRAMEGAAQRMTQYQMTEVRMMEEERRMTLFAHDRARGITEHLDSVLAQPLPLTAPGSLEAGPVGHSDYSEEQRRYYLNEVFHHHVHEPPPPPPSTRYGGQASGGNGRGRGTTIWIPIITFAIGGALGGCYVM